MKGVQELYTMISDRNLMHFQRKMAVSIHERNIKILSTEMFKVSRNLASPQMHECFKLKDQPQYNLRHNSLFSRPLVKSVYKGTESLSFLGPKIWDILPDTYKDLPDLNSFKVALTKLKLNLSYLDKLKKNSFINLSITLIYR